MMNSSYGKENLNFIQLMLSKQFVQIYSTGLSEKKMFFAVK